jgi:uncharacterized protein DUF4375
MAQRVHVPAHIAAESPHEVWNAFVDLISSEPSEPFTAEQRAAALVFWYESEVQNGGHLQYFSNRGPDEAAASVAALRQLGASDHAAVLQAALESIPWTPDGSPISLEEYVGIAREGPYDEFDQAFHDASPPLQSVLETYLKSHLSAFVTLDEGGA